jgi:hypothetical protein
MIPLPWKIVAALALTAALYGGWAWREAVVEQRGYDRAVAERQAQDDKRLAEALTETRAKEIALQERITQEAATRNEEKTRYEQTIADLRTAARRGDSGLRAPGKCLPADPAPAHPGAAAGPGAEEGHVLLPETAESVLGAAADIRQGVLDRNALIDLYNQMRAVCNDAR